MCSNDRRHGAGQGGTEAAIDDVVQETLLTVHRARATYDPARPFLPWLRAIAQRRAIDALRRTGRRPREVHDPLAYEAGVDDGPLPGHALAVVERDRILGAAVARLPEGQRQAIEHIALRELSLDEASASTGRTKGALKVNFHRALKTCATPSHLPRRARMPDPASHEQRVTDLVDELALSLRPVQRLPGPAMRTLAWCGAVLVLGAILLPIVDLGGLWARLGVPDLRYAALCAFLTSASAAFAAFQSSVPGRNPAWALLPLPPLVLWIGSAVWAACGDGSRHPPTSPSLRRCAAASRS